MYLQPSDFQQSHQEHTLEKGQSLQLLMLGKLDIHIKKKETRSFTMYKNQPRLIKDLKV
jgi:hypothetical protein